MCRRVTAYKFYADWFILILINWLILISPSPSPFISFKENNNVTIKWQTYRTVRHIACTNSYPIICSDTDIDFHFGYLIYWLTDRLTVNEDEAETRSCNVHVETSSAKLCYWQRDKHVRRRPIIIAWCRLWQRNNVQLHMPIHTVSRWSTCISDFYLAMLWHSEDYAVARCLSACPSVRLSVRHTLVLCPKCQTFFNRRIATPF